MNSQKAVLINLPRLAIVLLVAMACYGSYQLGKHSNLMPAPIVNIADTGFCQDMIVHHQQAVLMATLALERATPRIKPVALAILTSQSQEIGIMQGWLNVWGAPTFNRQPMAWMHSTEKPEHQHNDSTTMPGMASTAEITHLWETSGENFDNLFIRLMSHHHRGGIDMANAAIALAATTQVRAAARAMIFEQTKEISAMTALMTNNDTNKKP